MVCLFSSSIWIFLVPSSHQLLQTSCICNVLRQGQPYHGCIKSHLLLSPLNLVSTHLIWVHALLVAVEAVDHWSLHPLYAVCDFVRLGCRCSNSPRAKRLRFLACSLYEKPAILVISLPALLWTFCNFNAVPSLSRRTAHNLKCVNQGLIQWHLSYFPLLSLLFLFISTHFHLAFTEWSIITARSHLRMQAVISETTPVYADLGLSFPTCITLQLCTMNFSCCFIAQPFSLVGPFCNFSQFAHIPIILHNLVSSAVFTSCLIPFFDNVCIY